MDYGVIDRNPVKLGADEKGWRDTGQHKKKGRLNTGFT